MILLQSLPKHHALLLVEADRKEVSSSLWGELQKLSFANSFFDVTIFSIDDARSLSVWANTPFSSKKIALISFYSMTAPAQNALLKLVEEPREDVQFIFITSNKETLLPTLLSRMYVFYSTQRKDQDLSPLHIFLSTKKEERMRLPLINELLSLVDEEGRKDREHVRGFILSLARELRNDSSLREKTLELIELASYTSLPSSSSKALLEYISLTVPQKK